MSRIMRGSWVEEDWRALRRLRREDMKGSSEEEEENVES